MLSATRNLPPTYLQSRALDLTSRPGLMIILNVVGLLLFFAFGLAFLHLAAAFYPGIAFGISNFSALWGILAFLLAYAAVLVLHELVHGLFFVILTRSRPHFGIKQMYAYACAPDWYIPRNQFLVVGLAPLILITLAGFLILPLLGPSLVTFTLFAMAVNASGAIGDLYTVLWILRFPANAFVCDHGEKFNIYW
jgi:Putative zincin peptidase